MFTIFNWHVLKPKSNSQIYKQYCINFQLFGKYQFFFIFYLSIFANFPGPIFYTGNRGQNDSMPAVIQNTYNLSLFSLSLARSTLFQFCLSNYFLLPFILEKKLTKIHKTLNIENICSCKGEKLDFKRFFHLQILLYVNKWIWYF